MAKKISKNSAQNNANKIILIYVGPSIQGGILSRFRIYENGIPDKVFEGVKNRNALKKLFVKPEELGGAMLNVKVSGHPLNLCYKTIEKEFFKEDK